MIFNLLLIADTLAQIRATLLQTLQEMENIRGIGSGRGNFDLFDLFHRSNQTCLHHP